MILTKLRDIWIAFGGDPSDDKEVYKRYSSTAPFKPVGLDEEVIHCREAKFVRMKPLKVLVRQKKIVIDFISDDGEFMRYQSLDKDGKRIGPVIGTWTRGDELMLVVDCETIHMNEIKMNPELFEEVNLSETNSLCK